MTRVDIERSTAHSTRNASSCISGQDKRSSSHALPTDILKVVNWNYKSPLRGSFCHCPSDPFTFTRAVSIISQVETSRTSHALNVPLVNTVPCIRNLRNTIYRFPKDKIRTYVVQMNCMRRWRIQGTTDSHPLFTVCNTGIPSLSAFSRKMRRQTAAG